MGADLGALDSLMPMSMRGRISHIIITNENEDQIPHIHENLRTQRKLGQSRLSQQKGNPEVTKPAPKALEKNREFDPRLSQKLSVLSLNTDHRDQSKKKRIAQPIPSQPNHLDPNMLITMKLIDPNFDLAAFMNNMANSHRGGLNANSEFINSLEGLSPETRFNLRAIFMDQNFTLRKIEDAIKLTRNEKEREDRQLVLDKIRGIEKELSRREKDKKFDQFKSELFSVN
jgi:hypothetical protein